MAMKEQQTFEYWDREFESRRFESDVTYGSAHETWYRNGDFHVGYDAEDFRDKTCPKFGIVYHGNRQQEVKVTVRLSIAGYRYQHTGRGKHLFCEVSEFLMVMSALKEPKRLPMCIGIWWAEELVSIFLQQPAAGKI
jgi:hypothetical protein